MKKLLLILLLILGYKVNAQCDYADDSDAPKELFRKRLKDKEAGFRYGNPYTMFTREEGFNLSITLNQIRDNIFNGKPDTLKLFKIDTCGLTVQWQPLLRVPTNNI
jgi:hypothetical protein